jgi:hypothetical protein
VLDPVLRLPHPDRRSLVEHNFHSNDGLFQRIVVADVPPDELRGRIEIRWRSVRMHLRVQSIEYANGVPKLCETIHKKRSQKAGTACHQNTFGQDHLLCTLIAPTTRTDQDLRTRKGPR